VAHRLEREVKLLSRVKSPHVVRLLGSGEWQLPETREYLPFLVMEYVPGEQLYTWASQRNLRVRETLEVFRQSAVALRAVHEADAFHRDVKGENFLLDEGGRLVLVDLGVGDYAGSAPLTQARLPPGTEAYRSPESLRFEEEHRRDFEERYEFRAADDLYALGVTWYRALTDEFPFEELGPVGSMRARMEGQKPQAASARNPRVPKAVCGLLSRLLASNPEERPECARKVEEELEALLRGRSPELDAYLFEWEDASTRGHKRTRRRPEPALVPARRGWKVPVVVLVSLTLLTATIGLVLRAGPPSSTSHPTQELFPVREEKSPTDSSTAAEGQLPALEREFMKSLAKAACLVVVSTGCAGVPLKNTEWPQECPDAALAAMVRLGIMPGRQGWFTLDINQPGAASDYGVYRAGPIVGVFRELNSTDLLPEGTKVYGYMWTGGERIQAYFTRVELPDGRELPFCGALAFYEHKPGYWKGLAENTDMVDVVITEPGTFAISKSAPMTIVARFPKPE
jgi:serine/threonine protein kinase